MARPSYSDVWEYARRLQRVSQAARGEFMTIVDGIDLESPEAVEQLRQAVLYVVDRYGLAASELGAQWYEFCSEFEYDGGRTAIVGDVPRYGVVNDVDNAIARLNDGRSDMAKLVSDMAGVVVNQTHKSARDTIMSNLVDDLEQARRRGDWEAESRIGYARVTTSDACAFCVVLASRGFVYASEMTATRRRGDGGKYHRDCRCVAVPYTHAREILGYGDVLDSHMTAYEDANAMRRSGDMPKELKDRIDAARAEHMERYERGEVNERWRAINETLVIMRYNDPNMK